MRVNLPSFAVASLVALTLGCGQGGPPEPERYPVSGTVKLGGQPLPTGTVYFKNDAQTDFDSAEIQDGKYTGKAQAGDRRIEIVSIHTKEIDVDGMKSLQDINDVPKKYNSDSKLRAEVKPGEGNVFDFDLK